MAQLPVGIDPSKLSEDDLNRMGIPQSDIEKAKKEYFESKEVESKEVKQEKDSSTSATNLAIENSVQNEPKNSTISKSNKSDKGASGIYGHDIIKRGRLNVIENSNNLQAPNDYILKSGDRISVTIWGFTEFSGEYILDAYGNINPKLVGRINLKGKSFASARAIVSSRFGKAYSLENSQIDVDISYSDVISVNVVGEVENPGTYSLPSINTAMVFLSMASGVTNNGSLRDIEIKRGGSTIASIDVYKFLMDPAGFKDVYLENGDFIYVKPSIKQVEIKGSVKRPMKYELKPNETFSDLLVFTSGFSSNADRSAVHVNRIINSYREFMTFEMDAKEHLDFDLKDGDIIEVYDLSDYVSRKVQIRGAVNVPGGYAFKEGMELKDLIENAKGLSIDALDGNVFLYRLKDDLSKVVIKLSLSNSNSFDLRDGDEVYIPKKTELIHEKAIKLNGAIYQPGNYVFFDNYTLNDVILLGGGFKDEANTSRIEIERVVFNPLNSDTTTYIKTIKLDFDKDSDFVIQPYDIIHVRNLPDFKFHEVFEISGAVNFPGQYSLDSKNLRLSEAIQKCGGVTESAFLKGAKIIRSVDNIGVVLVDIEAVFKNPESKSNFIIKPGDRIIIPESQNIVSVSGEIGYRFINEDETSINAPFHKNKRAGFYIRKYGGGYGENAKRRKLYVVSSNGLVRTSRFFGLLKPRVHVGDKVVVEQKEKKKKKENEPIDWNKQIEGITVKLTGLATLYVLISRVN
jgi:protein involved in polysaccharide export with SLBB domain